MLETIIATVDRFDSSTIVLSDGTPVRSDVVVQCCGFHPNDVLRDIIPSTYPPIMKANGLMDENVMQIAEPHLDDTMTPYGESSLTLFRVQCNLLMFYRRNPSLQKDLFASKIPTCDLTRFTRAELHAGLEYAFKMHPGADALRVVEIQAVDEKYRARFSDSGDYIRKNRKEWEASFEYLAKRSTHPAVKGDGSKDNCERVCPYIGEIWCYHVSACLDVTDAFAKAFPPEKDGFEFRWNLRWARIPFFCNIIGAWFGRY